MISFFSNDVRTTYSVAYNMLFCAAEITEENFCRLVFENKEMLLEMAAGKKKELITFLSEEEDDV